MIYKKRIIRLPEKENIFLFGLRGSGKTALLKQLFPDALYIDLLDQSEYQSHLSDISKFYNTVSAFKNNDLIVIVDEIQKIPSLLNEVHRLIEESSRGENPPRRFILTGSSARKLKEPGINLLAGRAVTVALHPFIPEELEQDFNLKTALRYGLIPVVWSGQDKESKLKAYTETYLKEEIKAEALVRNLPGFTRFLEVAGLYHGQAVNMSAIARECQMPRHAVQDYFSILEDTMLGFFLPAYTSKLRLREKKNRKFYFADPGLTRALTKNFGPVSDQEKGALFEGLTAQILRAYKDYNSLYDEMFYWSPAEAQKTEVDFLLKRRDGLIAVEAKSGAQVSSKDYKGLKAIQNLPGIKKRILVYMGDTIRRTMDGIDIWPFSFFCQNLKEGNNFDSSPLSHEKKKKNNNFSSANVPTMENTISPAFRPSTLQIPPPDDEKDFEELCLALYTKEFGVLTHKKDCKEPAQIHGTKGQAQQGVDIFAPNNIGIQCKKRDYKTGQITKKELREEVKKAKKYNTPPLKRFILASTCKRDAHLQREARLITEEHKKENCFSVEIHSWDEIKQLFDKYPEVYQKYYGCMPAQPVQSRPTPENSLVVPSSFVTEIKSESHHSELNRVKRIMNKQPETAFKWLEKIKQEQWSTLDNKAKYKILTYMGYIKMNTMRVQLGADLAVQALQFDKENENAHTNCALAWFIKGDMEKAKEHIQKARKLNPVNKESYIIEMQINFKKGKSLKEIIQSLPEEMKNKPTTAHILADFSIKKEDYKEAEKQADIFYKKNSEDNPIMLSSYADIMLKIIEQDPDVRKAGKVTSQYKKNLIKIINIYKKILSDSEYSEFKKFKTFIRNVYINYAVALEFNEELDKAIAILKEVENHFPEDYNMHKKLTFLLLRKQAIAFTAIHGENKEYGFNTVFTLNKTRDYTEIEKRITTLPDNKKDVFEWSLLATIKFQKHKVEGIKILQKAGKLPFLNTNDKTLLKEDLIYKFLENNQITEAEQELNTLSESTSNNPLVHIIRSKIEARKGNKTQQKKNLEQAFNALQANKNNNQFIHQTAHEMYRLGMYEKCEPLFEKITNNKLQHTDIFTLLHIYFENGKNQKAIDLAEHLRQKFPMQAYPVNILFLIYEDLGDRKKAIQYYKDFITKNPNDHLIRIELILIYIKNNQLDSAKTLLAREFNLDQLSVELINRLAVAHSWIGNIQKALEILYQSIKKYPADSSLQAVYSELIFFRNKKEKNALPPPDTVSTNCFIKIKDLENQDETEMIIEKQADIYTPEHPLSKQFLGRKLKDIIQYQNKKYQITEIKNKYLHKFHEIAEHAEKRFPLKPFIKNMRIPEQTPAGFEKAFKKFAPETLQKQNKLAELFQYYNQGKAPIGWVSDIQGTHPIETMDMLIQSEKYKFISSLIGTEDYETPLTYLDNKPNIIMDISSLFFLHLIQMESFLEESKFNLYICQSTMDSIQTIIQKTEFHSKEGLLMLGFDKTEKLVKSFTPAEQMQQNVEFFKKMKQWAEQFCKIKPIPIALTINRKKKSDMTRVIGKKFLDPLLVAHNAKDTIFLSEDGVLSAFSKTHFNISRIRSFDIINWLKKEVIIDDMQTVQFTAKLVILNQTYIPVDHRILLFLLEKSQYVSNRPPFQRALFFLSAVSNFDGVIEVISKFFIDLFKNPGLLPYHKEMIVKEVLDKATLRAESVPYTVRKLMQSVQAKTILLPIQQRQILDSIKNWLNHKIY